MAVDIVARGMAAEALSGGGGGGGSSSLSGLTDVDISNPTDGQTLVYNATSGKWENGAGGGSSTLSGLTDVDISNPTDGQTLVYNATSGKWENGESAGGVLVITADSETYTLNHTWQEIVDAGFAILVIDTSEGPNNTYLDYCTLLGSSSTPSENNYTVWFGTVSPSYEPDEPTIIMPRFFTATANTGYPVLVEP